MSFLPTLPNLFFTKNDPDDPRLGEFFKAIPPSLDQTSKDDLVIIGYPDDEGIKMNGGRPGSFEGPKYIRQFLYKMAWPLAKKMDRKYFDNGDLNIKTNLEIRHQEAFETILEFQRRGLITVSFGGGHDYGFSDASGFVANNLNAKEKPIVINFDAHLDVRPTNHGNNSGTSFHRLLSQYGDQIDFVEIGLQPQCNSLAHRDWALKKKAHLFDLNDLPNGNLMSLFEKAIFKKLNKNTPVFVSFDIDCLTSSEAGGCSQSWVTGLKTQDCLKFLSQLYKQSNCRGLGIYEVAPSLDLDHRTAKTAALIAYYFIFNL